MSKIIILIIGLPGCGKTTISKVLAKDMNAVRLSTESIRAELLGIDNESVDCDFTKEQQKEVYEIITKMTKKYLNDYHTIVVDGVFRNENQRNMISEIKNAKIFKFYISCDENTIIKRLEERKSQKNIAPAGVHGYRKIKKEYKLPSVEEGFININNTDSLTKSINLIYKIIGEK